MGSPFDPAFEALPDRLSVFPLDGVLLLPGARLPLNIFEPRYLAMFDAALAGDRLIGMIQPEAGEAGRPIPNLYRVGCAGRIVSFSETDDGRYMTTLAGLIRFSIEIEADPPTPFRQVVPDFSAYQADMFASEQGAFINRESLISTLRLYFQAKGLNPDWDSIEKADAEALVTTLAMACPFSGAEKQLLLEADDLTKRTEVLTAVMEMAIHEAESDGPAH